MTVGDVYFDWSCAGLITWVVFKNKFCCLKWLIFFGFIVNESAAFIILMRVMREVDGHWIVWDVCWCEVAESTGRRARNVSDWIQALHWWGDDYGNETDGCSVTDIRLFVPRFWVECIKPWWTQKDWVCFINCLAECYVISDLKLWIHCLQRLYMIMKIYTGESWQCIDFDLHICNLFCL